MGWRSRAARGVVHAALAAVLVASVGCVRFNLLSTQEEIALGRQVAAQIEQKTRPCSDPRVQQYVAQVGARVARASGCSEVPFQYRVIDNDREVNAMALPGGPVYVYTGLLRVAQSEAELASVLGHETGHITAKHVAQRVSAEKGLNLLLGVAMGKNPSQAAQLATQLLSNVGFSQMSQRDEFEADELGVTYMRGAGYDPRASITFLQRLNTLSKTDPSPFARLFASHPPTSERIARVQRLIGSAPRAGGAATVITYPPIVVQPVAPGLKPQPASRPRSIEQWPQFAEGIILPPLGAGAGGLLKTLSEAAPPPQADGRSPKPGQEELMSCRNVTKGNVLASRVVVATTPAARRRGLLGRSSLTPDEGMLLVRCCSVHTLGMKFAIDIVFLDKLRRVVEIRPTVPPGVASVTSLGAHSTLELAAGTAALRRLEVGDQLLLAPASDDTKAQP